MTQCVIMNRRISTNRETDEVLNYPAFRGAGSAGASMRCCSLRPVLRRDRGFLVSFPLCHGNETEVITPTPATEAHLPRSENVPKTTHPADRHSRPGLRRGGDRHAARLLGDLADLAGGHRCHMEGRTGDRPLTVPSSLPAGRTLGGTRRSLREREPVTCPRWKFRNILIREHASLPLLTIAFVPKQPLESGGHLGNQGSRPAAAFRVDLTGASGRPIIRFPITTMKDSNTPATKADIQEVLRKVDERFDGLDGRIDGLDERIDGLDERVDGLDKGLNERIDGLDKKLDGIDRQLRILVERTHHDLGEASHDAEEVLKDHDACLEKRVERLEEAVGLTAV